MSDEIGMSEFIIFSLPPPQKTPCMKNCSNQQLACLRPCQGTFYAFWFYWLRGLSHLTHRSHAVCHSCLYMKTPKTWPYSLSFQNIIFLKKKKSTSNLLFCGLLLIVPYSIMFGVLITCAQTAFKFFFVLDSLWLAGGDKLEVVYGRCWASVI